MSQPLYYILKKSKISARKNMDLNAETDALLKYYLSQANGGIVYSGPLYQRGFGLGKYMKNL